MSLTAAELREMRERVDKATSPPWSPGHLCDDDSPCKCRYVLDDLHAGAVCTVGAPEDDGTNPGDNPPLNEAKANQVFIAAARTDVPRLLDEVEALRGALRAVVRHSDGYDIGADMKRDPRLTLEECAANWVRVIDLARAALPGEE